MSSATEASKKPVAEEPNVKRAKLDNEGNVPTDNNNGNVVANNEKQLDNNNGNSSEAPGSSEKTATRTIPTKSSANGNDSKNTENDLSAGSGHESDNVDDEGEDTFEDPKIANRLGQVEDIQSQISKLNEQASEEILKVEQKFNKLRRPYFEKRNALLKEVPNFWLTALANHPMIAQLIESFEDEDCLHYMTNVDVEELEDIKSGYNLKFYFNENPYIRNDLIVRELRHLDSEEVVTGTTAIEYKDTPEGTKLKELVENSIAHQARKVRPEMVPQSFFAWLSQQCEPGADDIAEIIKDQIWPSPLEFFFTTPDDYGDEGSDEDEDSEDDDDEEDYDDEEGIENEIQAIPSGGELGEGVIDDELEGEEFDDEDDDDDLEDEEGEDEE